MIDYQRDQQQTIPVDQVKIIGVGGAGANILDRVVLEGADASTMLVLNSDSRTLNSAMAGEKVQLGKKLTMGLGAGGDPDVGLRAAQEVETEIRDALRNQKIVFICVGLGGGTGSGAAPLVTRLAREQGAFVVVFATMPFEFEGRRRREQAETALNELSVLSNALVTFDNGKMGELVLANQGIHEAFAAADVMISQSINAVTRLVVKPGIINVGLDDLMSALKATKSRCLFGSGIADGENRSHKALKNALNSPLLDKGALLRSATTVLVYICGGTSLSLYEVELLMREIAKYVPENAHILFGAAVDDAMGDNLSVTMISALPEALLMAKNTPEPKKAKVVETSVVTPAKEEPKEIVETQVKEEKRAPVQEKIMPKIVDEVVEKTEVEASDSSTIIAEASTEKGTVVLESVSRNVDVPKAPKTADAEISKESASSVAKETLSVEELLEKHAIKKKETQVKPEPIPEKRVKEVEEELVIEEKIQKAVLPVTELPAKRQPAPTTPMSPELGADGKPQIELALDGGPKGKFSGETPNMVDGEDLDIPPFLRNR